MGKWVVQVPLSQSEYVKLYCQYGTSAGNNAAVAKMADLLLRCLASKTEMSLDLSSEAVEISELRTEPQAVKAPLTAKA